MSAQDAYLPRRRSSNFREWSDPPHPRDSQGCAGLDLSPFRVFTPQLRKVACQMSQPRLVELVRARSSCLVLVLTHQGRSDYTPGYNEVDVVFGCTRKAYNVFDGFQGFALILNRTLVGSAGFHSCRVCGFRWSYRL